jgi:hypothetical protein
VKYANYSKIQKYVVGEIMKSIRLR